MIRRSPRSTLFRYTTHFPISVRPRPGAPHGSGPGGDLRREMLRGAAARAGAGGPRAHDVERSEEHTSELQSQSNLVCRLLLEKKKNKVHRRAGSVSVEIFTTP